MNAYLEKIFSSDTVDDACDSLQQSLNSLRSTGYLASLPDYYANIEANSPEEVQDWFDEMNDDEEVNSNSHLKEVFDLFDATLRTLRKLGFHRNND